MEKVDLMYTAVKQKVLDLELDPTQPIDEKALVRESGESLTVVSQALQRLAADGLLVRERGRFRVTRAATTSVMSEIYEVRTPLEGMCARLAAERVTPDQVARIEQAHREFDRVIKAGDNKALLAVDRKFHQLLHEAAGNRFLGRALDEMYDLIYRFSYFALDRMGSVRANVEEHRAILDAIKEGDGRAAERLIQEHIAHFRQMVEQLL